MKQEKIDKFMGKALDILVVQSYSESKVKLQQGVELVFRERSSRS